MKYRILYILLFIGLAMQQAGAQAVKFSFTNGTISNGPLRQKMEYNTSLLLSEVNAANKDNRELRLTGIAIDPLSTRSLQAMWEHMHFSINDSDIRERCLNQESGFQARNISITITPLDEGFEGERIQELTISYTKAGQIAGVHLAIADHITHELFKGESVEDSRRRMEILAFVENFRNYYIEKNIDALEKIYADDALIITGTVMKQKTMNSLETKEVRVKYRTEDKTQYLTRLRNEIFARNRYINVNFDRVSIERCGTPGKTNFYGVTLHQDWSTISNAAAKGTTKPSYHDEGWLFLLWEFHEDGTDPVIHVRTWQPDEIILNEDSKINMHDFKF